MRLLASCSLALVAAGALSSCGSGPSSKFDPPNTEFAGELGIRTPPPVTEAQAMAIAAAAAGGTAVSVGQEMEGGQLYFEVQVDTPSGRKEVEVRASDGGVVEIESSDDD